ncbi:hypothetical protein OH77DRAFT_930996 [Trametes cingulata]|nr:hypothetical protein OH77DRAFT_930996 [Trametes cingulata]
MADTTTTPAPRPDPESLASAIASTLSSPPFVQIEGVFNVRDFGANYPVAGSAARVKPLFLFRSGEFSHITERGIAQLRSLGIRKVFDLRVDTEIAKYQTANKAIEGVEIVRAPVLQEGWEPSEIAQRLKEFEENPLDAFLKAYRRVLESGSASLEQVLVHLRDHPDEPCLIHCTAGKDRTGVFAAMILMLLGVRDEDITADYALTEIGMQPVLPMLSQRLQKEAVFRDNWAGTLNMGSSRPRLMQALLDYVRREYGGVEGYLRRYTSLNDEDFRRIRENLLV